MSTELFDKLYEEFPAEMIKQLRKGGANLAYIPVSEVITRLNRVLGIDRWSLQIIRVQRDEVDPDFIVAHVRLSIQFQDEEGRLREIIRDGMGGQKINRTKAGDPVDLGDDHKGAVSDATKKAASTLGVGLFLARDDDAIEAEQAQNTPPQPPAQNSDPEVDAAYVNFLSQAKALDEDGKAKLNTFWAEYSGGRPKPSRETATLPDLEALSAEAIRLTFSATVEG